jgi:hypothetical protein
MVARDLSFFTFTDKERAAQDSRLDPIIADLWKAGGIPWWRNQPELRAAHEEWLTRTMAGDTSAMADCLNMVLAMAIAASAPFVPVDVWPSVPPPAKLDPKARLAFQVIANTIREGAGVFTPGKLRRNKHYALLVAHLLFWPEEIGKGADIFDLCYPWPFVIKIDEEGSARLERQEDIRDEGWAAAQRIEATLFEDARQIDRLPYGTSPAAIDRRGMKAKRRLYAGEIANRLYETNDPEAIAKHSAFKAALAADGGAVVGKIGSGDRVLKLIRQYREANNLPRLPRGRPRKRPKS